MTDMMDQTMSSDMDRRRFLKGAAVVAWATPTILTLSASRAGASSCLPHGTLCNSCELDVSCCPTAEDGANTGPGTGCCCADFSVDCPAGLDGTCSATDAGCFSISAPASLGGRWR